MAANRRPDATPEATHRSDCERNAQIGVGSSADLVHDRHWKQAQPRCCRQSVRCSRRLTPTTRPSRTRVRAKRQAGPTHEAAALTVYTRHFGGSGSVGATAPFPAFDVVGSERQTRFRATMEGKSQPQDRAHAAGFTFTDQWDEARCLDAQSCRCRRPLCQLPAMPISFPSCK